VERRSSRPAASAPTASPTGRLVGRTAALATACGAGLAGRVVFEEIEVENVVVVRAH
jgi:hypothetical protein